ncbi:MAG: hypothetical protein KBC26_00045 [Candidatus Pacebacteria bacterium]|nr:hypothetical protein [Candidatus Paceibacterota bacterium]
MRCTLIAFLWIAITTNIAIAQSGGVTATPFGATSLSIPVESGQKFDLNWVRLGLDGKFEKHPRFIDGLAFQLEYELCGEVVKKSYIEAQKKFGDATTVFVAAGRWLDPVASVYPGPIALPLTRYQDASNEFRATNDGVRVRLVREGVSFQVAWWNSEGKHEASSSVVAGPVSLYYSSVDGYGGKVDVVAHQTYANLTVGGAVVWEGGDPFYLGGDGKTIFIQNEWRASNSLSAWILQEWRWSDVSNKRQSYPLVGWTYTYRPRSYLKVYYDKRDNSIQTRVTFSF